VIRFEDILEMVERHNPEGDLDLVRRAYVFSAKEHRGQVRRSGEPYMVHPLEVAYILAGMKLDVVTVAVGLLHDVLEDTEVTPEVIGEYFGQEVLHIVEGVTKLGRMFFDSTEEHQAENFRKMLMAMVDDIRVIMVKLADRLHNMRTLQFLAEEKRIRIAKETLEIYAPLASRLGINRMKQELENSSLMYLDPEQYEQIRNGMASTRKERDRQIERLKNIISKRLKAEDFEGRVEGRAKHLFSIWYKMRVKEVAFEEIYDMIGLRIILDSDEKADCYRVLGTIHDLWPAVPGRFRDFVNMPKENMYQSLHTTVIVENGMEVEVQIRTAEMHRLAEEGVAAHWMYKSMLGQGKGKGKKHQLRWMRELMEWQEELKDPREFLSTVKINLFPDEVYVFTPDGEVKSFPKGATPIDFAYAIHSDVGLHCVGAKVNGVIVPLKYELRVGDQVEILTSNQQKPNRDWLNLVVTARARAKIRAFIRTEEQERSREIGREILERELTRRGVSLRKFRKSGGLGGLVGEFNITGEESLLASIGYGKITPRMLANVLSRGDETAGSVEPDGPADLQEEVRDRRKLADLKKVVIKGVEDVMIRFSKCCNPVPGDEIIGFITRGKGLAIHTRTCPNMPSLDCNPDRLIEVQWARSQKGFHRVVISVSCEDRPGVLAAISSIISGMGVNIVRIDTGSSNEVHAVINLTVEFRDLPQLQNVMAKVRKAKGVISVERH
jgi:guanosine-3',5'-bis(diphosphate) 3'-pyrophosphohydrolase